MLNAVLGDLEIFLVQVGDDAVLLVAHRGKHVDDVGLNFQRPLPLILRRILLAGWPARWLPGWLIGPRVRNRRRGTLGRRLRRNAYVSRQCQCENARREVGQPHCIISL